MSLVAYSDSESEVEEAEEINIPRKKARTENAASNRPKAQLPPLPPSFRDLYATNVKLSPHDDPSLHEGRKRIIPHVPGRWPTHIQLEWYPNQQEMDLLGGLLEKASTVMSPGEDETKAPVVIRSLLRNDLGVQLPLHISLSRSVSLTTENKDLFPQVMRQAIEKSNIRPFTVTPTSLRWESNFERTRWFLVLGLTRPRNDELNRLLGICNRALAGFGQPPLYAESVETAEGKESSDKDKQTSRKRPRHATDTGDFTSCFHISIAWTLCEPSEEERKAIASLDVNERGKLEVAFDSIKARIGNGVHTFGLPASQNVNETWFGVV